MPNNVADIVSGWTRIPRVMVVDDERIIADTLALILKRKGYEATALYSAQDALEQLDVDDGDHPDLLISDVVLDPDSITGIDLAIYFERHCSAGKVLLISGNAVTNTLHTEARRAGHNFPLLQKPIAPEKLLGIVHDMLGHLHRQEGVKQVS